ncbi:MAG: enoyl-CoA hydratase/isomerase family protein [Anaerolineae bacterium]|nr:enoyl-CoA hydratase/isomerase family protein [Anaerolineae bacterium]
MDFQTILLQDAPPFAAITLNRPARHNAMSFQMIEELIAAFNALRERPDIRAVVISGAGDHFCVGGDINDLKAAGGMAAEAQDEAVSGIDRLLRRIIKAPQVVIARVHGSALGGGFGLVCACDIAIGAVDASFGLPEARLGIVPALIAPYVIRRIGLSRAGVIMLTGARFDGVSAHEYGVIHEVCPKDILDECIDAVLNEIHQCSPAALRACKQLLQVSESQSLEQSLPFRTRTLNTLRAGEDGQEGMLAFMQKRPPKWAIE